MPSNAALLKCSTSYDFGKITSSCNVYLPGRCKNLDSIWLSRTFDSFDDRPAKYIIEFDASLTGVGILWFHRMENAEVCRGGGVVNLSRLHFNSDSSNQNLAEFVAALLGVIGLVKLGITVVDIEFIGDSMTALAWPKSNVAKGERATNAAVIFTMLCLKFGIDIKETCHISAKDNYRCDRLSRLKESGREIISLVADFGFEGDRILRFESDIAVTSLIDCRRWYLNTL